MKTSNSEKALDRQIAALEDKLSALKKKKLVHAQARLREAERLVQELSGGGSSSGSVRGQGKASKTGPRGPRLSDEEVVERLTRVVKAAGEEGISARSAAEEAGVFYLRAIKVMDSHFKKTGVAKWTRYRVK
jgi:hypothetical protein